MKINRVDLGYNPMRAPSYQQMLGDVFVEHATTISYERGAGPREMSVVAWVQAQTPIGGNVPGSQAANEVLARWLEELATNPDLNDPVLVNWSSLRALPQDGWWYIVSCSPNYKWTGAGRIPVTMTFRQRASLGAPVCTFWGGGALPSAYTAVPQNLVGLPQNAVGIVSSVRSGSEGGSPVVLNPPSAAGGTQGIVQFLESAAQDDWFKAGARLYDAMAAIGTNPVPGGLGVGGNMLTNPGFELNDGNWLSNNVGSGTSNAFDASTPHNGTRNLQLTNPSVGNYGGIFNRVGMPVTGLSQLNVSAWVKGSAGGATGPIRITFANPGLLISSAGIASAQPSAQAGVTQYDLQPTVTTSYAQYGQTVQVPTGYAWAFIEIYGNGNGTPATIWWDDIAVVCTAFNTNWVEVLGVEHAFAGDLVFTNGLLLVTVSLNGSVQLYAWTRAGTWGQVGAIQSVDNTGNVGVPLAVDIWKVGLEEIGLDVTYVGAASSATISMRLQRGQRVLRLGVTPKSYDNTSASSVRFVPSVGGAMTVFNEALVNDQTYGAGLLASTAIYPQGSGFVPSTAWPFIVSLLYQGATGQVPAQQPGYGTSGAGLNLGDTSGPSQNGTRLYGIGVTAFNDPGNFGTSHLRADYKDGTLSGGAVTAADAATRSGTAVKFPATTVTGAKADTTAILGGNGANIIPAGTYAYFVRLRVSSTASGVAQVQLLVWNGSANVLVTTIAPNSSGTYNGKAWAVGTSYSWIPAGVFTADGVLPFGAYVFLSGTAVPDWFFDQGVVVPVTLAQFKDGPQELAQQYLFERTTRYPVV